MVAAAKCDPLSDYFVDHHKLGVFLASGFGSYGGAPDGEWECSDGEDEEPPGLPGMFVDQWNCDDQSAKRAHGTGGERGKSAAEPGGEEAGKGGGHARAAVGETFTAATARSVERTSVNVNDETRLLQWLLTAPFNHCDGPCNGTRLVIHIRFVFTESTACFARLEWRGDDVLSTRPVPQIEELAALTAEGDERIGALNGLAANRTLHTTILAGKRGRLRPVQRHDLN